MSEINKRLLELNTKEEKETEAQYQKDGTITFDVYDDDDFARLLISLLRESIIQKRNQQKMISENGIGVYNRDLNFVNHLIDKMKMANSDLAKEVIANFVLSQKPKEPKYYGKHCKKCRHNIKVYYGKKENPCHRCGEVN